MSLPHEAGGIRDNFACEVVTGTNGVRSEGVWSDELNLKVEVSASSNELSEFFSVMPS
ncbi:hypothetical protein GCM10007874_66240 [Labrys miyagiensis]|uniref:Uncharacterized protein n=1 Tax=Labrys miyagiensis TaxID=346912 RepID=A0ABQ6CUX2_9HYPH|nr:hypothetical protein GCM10007874_66240 [Labrys miyagiensis]